MRYRMCYMEYGIWCDLGKIVQIKEGDQWGGLCTRTRIRPREERMKRGSKRCISPYPLSPISRT
jgi:hypothetical protein